MSCYRCICNSCANNVERLCTLHGEADFGCFNCDTCVVYIGSVLDSQYNKKVECPRYKASAAGKAEKSRAKAERLRRSEKLTEAARTALRASLVVIEGGKRRNPK